MSYQAGSFRTRRLLAVLPLVFSGCAIGPVPIDIQGQAAPVINRDGNGAPLSVVVRVYQLRTQDAFNKLSFDMVSSGRSDSELLGSDLVGKTELIMVPGKKSLGFDKLLPEAKYLGIVALFRKPDAQYWRYLVDAQAVRSKGLRFSVQECYLTLEGMNPTAIPGQPLNAKPTCAAPQPPQAKSTVHTRKSKARMRRMVQSQ